MSNLLENKPLNNMLAKLFIDIHVIQTVPPSCLNRDGTGTPKTAEYGNVLRARVSSQSWKHAMRLMFCERFGGLGLDMGIRSKRISACLADELKALDPTLNDDTALEMAVGAMKVSGLMPNPKPKKGGNKDGEDEDSVEEKKDTLIFVSPRQLKNLAALLISNPKAKSSEMEAVLVKDNTVDIALYGRMMASNNKLNVDACVQVAHAISTHSVGVEYDYYSASDDRKDLQEHSGGAHLGTTSFLSATLYRFSTLAVHELAKTFSGDTLEKVISEHINAFINSLPSGKQNSFAAQTPPSAVLITLRSDRPVNMAGAFETPINTCGVEAASAKALEKYALEVYEDICGKPDESYYAGRLFTDALGTRLKFGSDKNAISNISKDAVSRVV